MTPLKRASHQCIAAVLTQRLEQVLLSSHVGPRDVDCRIIRLQGLDVDCALLLGCPAFTDQRPVPVPGYLRELQVGLRLLQRRSEPIERRFVLGNLVIESGTASPASKSPCLTRSPISTFRFSI